MNTRIGDVPQMFCLVRKEFLRQGVDGHGDYEEGIIVGAVVRKDMALCFTVLLKSGALWYDLPIHAVVHAPCEPWPLERCQMWDCLSDQWVAHCYNHLAELSVDVALNYAGKPVVREGGYLFTIDFMRGFYADHPSEHKTLNIIQMEKSGHIVAYPNNRCLFHDKTFTEHTGRPDYLATNRQWYCETWDRTLDDIGQAWGVESHETKGKNNHA